MGLLERLGKRKANQRGEVLVPVTGKLVTDKGVIKQFYDPDTGEVYMTEFSSPEVKEEAAIRGMGTDFTIGEGGRVAEIHPRFQRTKDNPLNPPARGKTKLRLR